MNKEEKAKTIELLKEKFSRAELVMLFDYKGITVDQINSLRRKLEKAVDSDLLIFKNTLAIRAVSGTDKEPIAEYLAGPNAGLFTYGEPVEGAKVLVEMAGEIKAIDVKAGMMGDKLLLADDIKALSKLPGREQLLSMFLGTLNAPATSFVSLFANVPRGLLNVLNGLKEKKESEAA